jgi:hypothetical protein
MSQSYLKECIFCKTKIRMSDKKENKWLPYNLDNTEHDCKKKNGNDKLTNGRNEISLELVIKKLASVGVTINLEKLRNASV